MTAKRYPACWPKIARAVKDAAGWRCIRCDHTHDVEAGYMLTVHHLDMQPENCRWWNLTALCQRCHLHIQGKVRMHQVWPFEHSDWFRPYVAGFYASVYGLPDDRETVEAHVDALIALGQGRRSLKELRQKMEITP